MKNLPTLVTYFLALTLASSLASHAAMIFPELDFAASNTGVGGTTLGDVSIGDFGGGDGNSSANGNNRGIFRFNLNGINVTNLETAVFNLTLLQTRKDQFPDPGQISSSPPFVNPGLGDLQVINIADFGTNNGNAYASTSIGNDPGILVASGVQPNSAQLSIDVFAAVQSALTNEESTVTFQVRTAVDTDGDFLNDRFFFAASENADSAASPFILVNTTAVPEPTTYALMILGITMLFFWQRRMKRRQTLPLTARLYQPDSKKV